MDLVVALGSALVAGAILLVAPWETLLTAGLAAAILRASPHPPRVAALALAAVALVAGYGRARLAIDAHEGRRQAVLAVAPAPTRCAARVRVVESPVSAHGSPRWQADLEDLACDADPGRAVHAPGWTATLYGGPEGLARGDRLDVVAQLARPQRFWNVETGDPRPAEARRGSVLSGGVVDATLVSRGRGPAAWIDRARHAVRSRIEATFPPDAAPMARALVLGESDLSGDDDADFRASGLSHLLAVSGMHLVLVVAGFVKILEAVLVRVPALAARGDAGRLVAAIALPLVWAYADFAGGGGSTIRAAWMMTAALAARAIGRRGAASRSFGLSLVAMAARDPLVVFDVSFLLSAGATLGLIALSRPIARAAASRLPAGDRWPHRAAAWATTTASATLAATVPCAPILARFAPTLPAGGVIANLLAVPLGETIALPLCLAHAALSPFPSAERGAAAVASGALWLVRGVARAFAHARWALVSVPPPSAWQCALLAAALLGGIVLPRGRRGPAILALVVVGLLEVGARAASRPRGALRATFLDVGQGDSALVDLPDGEALLIDGGGLVGSPVDTGVRVVAPVLRARRRASLAAVVLSHPHPDHFTGLATGLGGVRFGALWDSGQGEREGVAGAYAALLANAREEGARVLRPAQLCGARAMGGAIVEVLAPCPDSTSDRGPNDNSIVLRVTYGRRAFLFVGDAEAEEEHDLLARGGALLHADVLKVGHHGSRTSSSPRFLAAVAPSVAVISAGVRNRFGHPHASTLRSLADAGVRVLRTDRDGQVRVWTDGDRLEVRAAAGEARAELW